jgi:hypothetical protein
MLIKLTREKSGNILFDENLVCQIEFLRVVFDKYGKSAVAYVIWYADIDSIFNDLPDQLKEEQIGTSCGLDKKVIKSKEIEYAIFEYDKFCKSKASGVFLDGYRTQMRNIGNFLKTQHIDLDTIEKVSKTLKDNADLIDRVSALEDTYREDEAELSKLLIVGGRKPTIREKKMMEEYKEKL